LEEIDRISGQGERQTNQCLGVSAAKSPRVKKNYR